MASYGVPTEIEGALPWQWAEERLVNNRNYWVVTVDPQHRPHAMPVWGPWDSDEEQFWFSSAPDSLKSRNIAANPHVVVTGSDTVEVVSVEGVASPATARAKIADAYSGKYEEDPGRRKELASFFRAGGVFRVDPIRAFAVIEREEDFGTRATRWVW